MIDAAVREELRRAETDEELLAAVTRKARASGTLVRDVLLDLDATGVLIDKLALSVTGRHPDWIGLRTRAGRKTHLAAISRETGREEVPLLTDRPACRTGATEPTYGLSWHSYELTSHLLSGRQGCSRCSHVWHYLRAYSNNLRSKSRLQARSAGLLPAECAAGIHTGNLVTRTGDPYTRCADCETPLS